MLQARVLFLNSVIKVPLGQVKSYSGERTTISKRSNHQRPFITETHHGLHQVPEFFCIYSYLYLASYPTFNELLSSFLLQHRQGQ